MIREIDFGIINIDKPTGPASFQISEYIRKSLGIEKAGHMGTLDPQVSGVLPICLNKACRLAPYLLKKDKAYVGIMRLHEDIDISKLKEEVKKMTGKIMQMPPVRSNVKRALREREVFSFEIIEMDESGKDVLFMAHVEAGTYIRTLINDLGKKIGGAHMLELRRIQAGIFHESHSVTLYDFDKAVEAYKNSDEKLLKKIIIPAEDIIKKIFPIIKIKKESVIEILRGRPIFERDLVSKVKVKKESDLAAVFCEDRFIEIAKIVLDKDLIAKAEFVLA